jgi:hypothetical protein
MGCEDMGVGERCSLDFRVRRRTAALINGCNVMLGCRRTFELSSRACSPCGTRPRAWTASTPVNASARIGAPGSVPTRSTSWLRSDSCIERRIRVGLEADLFSASFHRACLRAARSGHLWSSIARDSSGCPFGRRAQRRPSTWHVPEHLHRRFQGVRPITFRLVGLFHFFVESTQLILAARRVGVLRAPSFATGARLSTSTA